ncbi:ankyrin repeat and SOCS box protein 7-like [Haliotis asinina]|uniref:ankyrin repeat and SOCS box protein 7-like n=1 Tax=Haliotis asinina TaxID=109174 RepID=UPI003531B529
MGQCLRHTDYLARNEVTLYNLRTLTSIIHEGDVDTIVSYIRENRISEKSYKQLPMYRIGPLETACRKGCVDLITALIEEGFSPRGMLSVSPMNIACQHNNLDVVRTLADRYRVSLKKPDRNGNTPLKRAIQFNSVCVYKYLRQKGISLSVLNRGNEVFFPLHDAAKKGHSDMCRLLIDEGFDVKEVGTDGSTPIQLAAMNLRADTCRVLLEAGADVNTISICDVTKTFIEGNIKGILKNRAYLDTVRLLVSYGADPEVQDTSGNTPVHLVLGNTPALRCLTFGLNVALDKVNNNNQTPYSLALQSEDLAAAASNLLRAGYFPSLKESLVKVSEDHPYLKTKHGQCILGNLRTVTSNPRSLQDMCCFTLRRLFGVRLHCVVHLLPLPEKLKDILQLKHQLPPAVAKSYIYINQHDIRSPVVTPGKEPTCF